MVLPAPQGCNTRQHFFFNYWCIMNIFEYILNSNGVNQLFFLYIIKSLFGILKAPPPLSLTRVFSRQYRTKWEEQLWTLFTLMNLNIKAAKLNSFCSGMLTVHQSLGGISPKVIYRQYAWWSTHVRNSMSAIAPYFMLFVFNQGAWTLLWSSLLCWF